MEIIYAALLLHKAGKEITEDSVKKVLDAASINVDVSKIKALIAALEGVDIDKAIQEAAVVPTAAAPVAGGEEKAAEKTEEKSKEDEKKDEEQAAAGLGALFG